MARCRVARGILAIQIYVGCIILLTTLAGYISLVRPLGPQNNQTKTSHFTEEFF